MPVLHEGEELPAWSELREYRIDGADAGARTTFQSARPRQKLMVVTGRIVVHGDGPARELGPGETTDPRGSSAITVEYVEAGRCVWMAGDWGEDTGKSGVFSVERSEAPHDVGDVVSYRKETTFDSHYHDCDEFWVIVSGSGTAVSEGQRYVVGPGDCVATRMGEHHDFPLVDEPVTAVFFETTLQGQARLGHLWEHTHGPALPPGGTP